MERETALAEYFHERAKIRRDDRKAAPHVLCHHQTKNLSAQGRSHDYVGPGERGFKLIVVKAASKLNSVGETRVSGERL
jgi:hypothetical protein